MFFEQFAFPEGANDIERLGNQRRTSRAHHGGSRDPGEIKMINTGVNEGSAKIYQFPAGAYPPGQRR